jgi:predicted helicase
MRASGIDNAEGKQRIIIELYDKFFKTAFPKMVEKLGIVYTPVEVVDFIVHSVNDVLKKEFDRSISDENIHVLDPFTGTGTFISRLLQSGLIEKKDLKRKYQHEIHANEIVLLAYYIAAVNIENSFHDALEQKDYMAFEGICLTDTFQLGETDESEKLFSDMFPQNSARVAKQKKAPLKVIMGNPPYSVGQKSANDNAQNQSYEKLDNRISKTYAALTEATNKNSLYDSYIKAFRWSTDRLDKNGGIVCFVSNGAWLDGNSSDGFRKCLEKEFSTIYVFNLRGNQRTSGELSRKEGGKIFGSGSRTQIAITLLVKNPAAKKQTATIHYHDIGDYLSREEKLAIVKGFHSIMSPSIPLKTLEPNEFGDWISLRNDLFGTFTELVPLRKFDVKSNSYFTLNSMGLGSSRDAWVYNSSKKKLTNNIKKTIEFYNTQVVGFKAAKEKNSNLKVDDFIDRNPTQISWSSSLIPNVERGKEAIFESKSIAIAAYRPFNKQYLYYGDKLIHRKGQFDEIFKENEKNLVISVSVGNKGLGLLISDCVADIHFNGDTQCFPLYYFEERQKLNKSLFDAEGEGEYIRRDGISDFILERGKKQYGKNVSKEDIFYYVYGFLHNLEYREIFENDLKKMLPRMPLVEDVRDFWAFSKAGRKLAELHINYENVPAYKGARVTGANSDFFAVEKMRFPRKDQKDTILFNSKITLSNIPEKAYEYVVNGKSAIEWIMERYQLTTHKESGITNDPNDWAKEVGNPRYILDLLLSVINVSVQTVDIVEGLPKVKFD